MTSYNPSLTHQFPHPLQSHQPFTCPAAIHPTLGTVQPHQYAPAIGLPSHDHFGAAAPAPAPRVPVSHAALYEGLNQTNKDIKSIRGWHGSRLAVTAGVIGGILVAAGGAVAIFFTGGTAAMGAAAVAAGVGVTVGGGIAGTFKTLFGKRECKKNPQLMEKIVVLTRLREELKANRTALNHEQKQLYKDLRAITRKVDRGTLAEASAMVGRTAAGVAGGAASVLVIAAIGAAGGEGADGCFFWGNTPTSFGGGGTSRGGPSNLSHASTQPSGVQLTPDELSKLQMPLAR